MDLCVVINSDSGNPYFCKEIEVGGTQADSTLSAIIPLAPGDFFEPWITNTDNNADVNIFGLTCTTHRVDG